MLGGTAEAFQAVTSSPAAVSKCAWRRWFAIKLDAHVPTECLLLPLNSVSQLLDSLGHEKKIMSKYTKPASPVCRTSTLA